MAGARIHGADYFDDMTGVGGILESKGLDDYEGLKEEVKPEGIEVKLNCWGCNRPREVVIEWPEVILVAENKQGAPPVLPPGWKYSANNHTAYIAFNCRGCGQHEGIAVHMTPQEAQEHVKRGLGAGFVNPQQIQAIRQKMAPYRR